EFVASTQPFLPGYGLPEFALCLNAASIFGQYFLEFRIVAHTRPRIFAVHQRRPIKRNRQSRKNSGGLPSNQCPLNWRIHPAAKSDTGTVHMRGTTISSRKSGTEAAINGIPMVWQNRFTGC